MLITKEATRNSKAIAIVCVMVGHLISSHKTAFPLYLQEFATFSVGVFLFLSGYGLTKSIESNGLKNFLTKKFLSVYIPFVLATLVTSIYRGAYETNPQEVIFTITYLSAHLKIDPTMWFVYFISAWYVSFYVIFLIFKSNYLRIIALFAISILLSNFPSKSYSYVLHSMFSLHAFTFPLGVLISLFVHTSKKQNILISGSLVLAFVGAFYAMVNHYNIPVVMINSIIFAITLPLIFSIIDFSNRLIAFLGAYSYEIYLFGGIFRWNNFSQNKITNAAIFFITVLTLAYTFKPVSSFAQQLIGRYLTFIGSKGKP
ncbi:acyltransferase family protein [Cronobacter dublinensis]